MTQALTKEVIGELSAHRVFRRRRSPRHGPRGTPAWRSAPGGADVGWLRSASAGAWAGLCQRSLESFHPGAAVRPPVRVHGDLGLGTWTYFGGHDPEDAEHEIGDEATDLSLHPNSPGYRLILNNVLFPAAKKKTLKT